MASVRRGCVWETRTFKALQYDEARQAWERVSAAPRRTPTNPHLATFAEVPGRQRRGRSGAHPPPYRGLQGPCAEFLSARAAAPQFQSALRRTFADILSIDRASSRRPSGSSTARIGSAVRAVRGSDGP